MEFKDLKLGQKVWLDGVERKIRGLWYGQTNGQPRIALEADRAIDFDEVVGERRLRFTPPPKERVKVTYFRYHMVDASRNFMITSWTTKNWEYVQGAQRDWKLLKTQSQTHEYELP